MNTSDVSVLAGEVIDTGRLRHTEVWSSGGGGGGYVGQSGGKVNVSTPRVHIHGIDAPNGRHSRTHNGNHSLCTPSMVHSWLAAIALAIGLVISIPASAASTSPPPAILRFDFVKSIKAQIANPTRFADVLVKRVDAEKAGMWSTDGDLALWQYSIKIPGAINLGFYADDVFLPKGSTVMLISGDESVIYSGDRFKRGTLITTAMPGDELLIQLRIPAAQRATSRFQIQRFNVGYRSVDGSGPAHPAYAKLRAEWLAKQASATGADPKAGSTDTACDINYRCELDKNSAIQELGDATVGVTFSGIGFCSGALVMDASGSFTPFVATAAHCIDYGDSPILNGDDGIIFYWKKETPCGQALAQISRDPGEETVGGVVRAQYQDGLLVEALDPPAWGANPWWGGWDATDATNYVDPTIGSKPFCDPSNAAYDPAQECKGLKEVELIGIHHGRTRAKQYVRSGVSRSDTASHPELTMQSRGRGLPYTDSSGASHTGPDPDVWALQLTPVTATGRVMGGSSGSSLWIASTKRTIGTAFAAQDSTCPSGDAGQSPVYQRFAVAYRGPAGATSANAFKFWLDPSSTGISVRDGSYQASRAGASTVSFTPDAATKAPNSTLTLSWSTAKAGFCRLSGGSLTDHGVVANGSESVNVGAATGAQTYTLSCKNDAQVVTTKTVTINVATATPAPTVSFSGNPLTITRGASSTLTWSSTNATSCTASGEWTGSKATSGTQAVTPSSTGSKTYSLSCTGAGGTTSQSVTVQVNAPAPTLTFNASPESVMLGNSSTLSWSTTDATGCNASGAWSGSRFTAGNQGVISSTVGTLTYTLSCGGPGGTVTKSVSVTTTSIPDGSSSGGSGSGGGASGSGGSGGGALGPWTLLIALAGLRRKKK